MAEKVKRIWTIGHSILTLEDFISSLRSAGIEALADVRRFPGSRRYPHFSAESLAHSLPHNSIQYVHFPELGGRRKAAPDSINTAWRNDHFRAYADYMSTLEFKQGIEMLASLAIKANTAIMCAEAVWWRCHRGLISDYFKAQGVEVLHIIGKKIEEHPYTGAARIAHGQLVYTLPEEQMDMKL